MAEKKSPAKKVAPNDPAKNWDMDRIFWGLLITLVGVMALLHSLGVISINIWNILKLWPLIIILIGVSVLDFKGLWWKIVSAIVMVASLGLVAWALVDDNSVASKNGDVYNSEIKAASESVKNLELAIHTGAIDLGVDSHDDTDRLVKATLTSDMMELESDSILDGDTQKVILKTNGIGWIGQSFGNDLDVSISQRLPLSLTIDAGASKTKADLSALNLTSLTVDNGASSSEIKLGDKADMTRVSLDAGASSLTLSVPTSSGVRIEYDGGLSNKNFDDSIKEISEDVYESDGYEAADKKIVIKADIGAASLTIERY